MENKRIQKELKEMNTLGVKGFQNLKPDDSNIRVWDGIILPEKAPYLKGAFKVNITFPDTYPFKPPVIVFKTKIYHPNVDEKGSVCLNIINPENWKPSTKISQEALIDLINDPEPTHPLRVDLAEQFTTDRNKFNKAAEDFTKKYAEKRPSK